MARYHYYEYELIGDDQRLLFGPAFWANPHMLAITGMTDSGAFTWERIYPKRDYSRANSKGSRGVYATYELPEGLFYKVNRRVSWKRSVVEWLFVGDLGAKTVEQSYVTAACGTATYKDMSKAIFFKPQPALPVADQPEPTNSLKPWRRDLGYDVLTAAKARLSLIFELFPCVYLSFSAGKDSTVLLHLAADEARKRGRKFGLLLIDLEAQYTATIEHAESMFDEYKDVVEPYWLALPISLRNATSMIQPKWKCWDPVASDAWVRQPPRRAITDSWMFPWFSEGMEFEDLVEDFGEWYGKGKLTACLVGIRADESLNRWRAVTGQAARFQALKWTTKKRGPVYNAYPIYDWKGADIWTYHAKTGKAYNRIYDLMFLAKVPYGHMRICQPFGDDQKRGLWLYHLLEPDTWPKVVARVAGANSGALYAQESGAFTGRVHVPKPAHMTWKEFCKCLLETMPPETKEHFEIKIGVFLSWHAQRGYPCDIPDEADPKEEAARKAPSWRRVAKVLLKNDWWCKGLSFSQHVSDSYERYVKIKKRRESQWKNLLTR